MHYFAAVVLPPGTTDENIEERVTGAMEPYREEYTDKGGFRGEWDWWVLGGRWTGVWSDYDPTTDPANLEASCFICAGTGVRNDSAGRAQREQHPEYTCNGCSGTGRHLKHAGRWRRHDGDVITVAGFLADETLQYPYTLVIPEGGFHSKETYHPEREISQRFEEDPDWAGTIRKLLVGREHCVLAVVDYHS
jgi:hypothetical protein